MISKRTAITALLAGMIGKMAHADEKDQIIDTSTPHPTTVTHTQFSLVQHWTINLDQTTGITLSLNGERLTISAEEIMEALRR